MFWRAQYALSNVFDVKLNIRVLKRVELPCKESLGRVAVLDDD